MKKSSLHFKVASWSIKNPGQSYAAIGAALVLVLMLCVALTMWATRKPSTSPARSQPSTAIAVTQGQTAFERTGWVITSRQMLGEKQCVLYRRTSNGTRLTSCYVRQGEQWVFQQSF